MDQAENLRNVIKLKNQDIKVTWLYKNLYQVMIVLYLTVNFIVVKIKRYS